MGSQATHLTIFPFSPPPAEVLWAATRPRRRALCLGFRYEIHAPPQQLNDEQEKNRKKKKKTVCQTSHELRRTHIYGDRARGGRRGDDEEEEEKNPPEKGEELCNVQKKREEKTSTSILCLHCVSWCSICQVLLKMSHQDFMVHLKDDWLCNKF